MNLKKTFRKWRKRQKNTKILRLDQGDYDLIAELSKIRNKKKYYVKVFRHKGRGIFKNIESKAYSTITDAKKRFKKVMELF